MWRRFAGIAGIVLAGLLTGYFLLFALRTFRWEDLAAVADRTSIVAMCGAAVLYVLVIPFAGRAWSLLLAEAGLPWRWTKCAGVIAVTQIAKYIPGNVAQHVGRATLALRHGMTADVFATTVVLETLLTIAAALLFGVVGWWLFWRADGGAATGATQVLVTAAGGLVVGVLLGGGLYRLLGWLRHHAAWARRWLSAELPLPRLPVVLAAGAGYALNFLVLGAALYLVCHGLGLTLGYAFLATAFALAWLVGFLAPGLPAGLGVREGVLSLLLAGQVGDAALLNVMLAMRVVTMAGDVLCFLLGLWLMRLESGRAPPVRLESGP